MDKSTPCNRICLWSGPRNVSTAMMYSFAQRKDTVVYDEPFYGFYLDKTNAKYYHPGADEVMNSLSCDYSDVIELIEGEHQKSVAFFKNMTHPILGADIEFTKYTKNIILVRNPIDMLPSFDKVIPNPTLNDVGYESSWSLLNQLNNNKSHVVVIDSKNLLENPSVFLKKLCKSIDIEFDEKMLSWKKGPIQEDGIWAEYWYDNVHKSTGFNSYSGSNSDFPAHLNQLLKECIPFYDKLMNWSI